MALLEVKDLHTSFFTDAGEVKAVDGVSFELDRGKVLGIVGESGSGKSVTAYSIMQILAPTGKIVGGSVKLDGTELVGADENILRKVRGNRISIIFQDPMTSLNPTYTIGHQLVEAIRLHTDRNRKQAWDRALEMLQLVNVNEPRRRLKQYPFELSGGMRQRVMIAMALACQPSLLICDEPTTALDVTIQAQILQLIDKMREELGTAVMLITHDMGVVSEMADWVLVMYAGRLVEYTNAYELFTNPEHPYTTGLIASIPQLDGRVEELYAIPGNVPMLDELPTGCLFNPRCPYARAGLCDKEFPPMTPVNGKKNHHVACWKFTEKWGDA